MFCFFFCFVSKFVALRTSMSSMRFLYSSSFALSSEFSFFRWCRSSCLGGWLSFISISAARALSKKSQDCGSSCRCGSKEEEEAMDLGRRRRRKKRRPRKDQRRVALLPTFEETVTFANVTRYSQTVRADVPESLHYQINGMSEIPLLVGEMFQREEGAPHTERLQVLTLPSLPEEGEAGKQLSCSVLFCCMSVYCCFFGENF